MSGKIILLVLFAAFLGSLGQLFFKKGSANLSFNVMSLLTNWYLILGLCLYGISTIIYVYALSYGELSMLYPIIATSYIWTCFLAVLILGEHMSFVNWVGILFILLGVSLVLK
ncbi:MAG: hypothetical protein DRP06_04550 [Candidatus Aenigmatarchaeota archaeon]|nr:MAG: hypothetical protein DRP06_04550 [Candidatus Aenigmarchaeota archaeon]